MFLDEAYRILEVQPSASDEEIKAAHRDLTKVWHPDRFATDASMQRKAEEKLKQINEALVVVQAARGGTRTRWSPPRPVARANGERAILLWVFSLVFAAFFILLRRPTVGGLIIAGILGAAAILLLIRTKRLR